MHRDECRNCDVADVACCTIKLLLYISLFAIKAATDKCRHNTENRGQQHKTCTHKKEKRATDIKT